MRCPGCKRVTKLRPLCRECVAALRRGESVRNDPPPSISAPAPSQTPEQMAADLEEARLRAVYNAEVQRHPDRSDWRSWRKGR